MNPSYPARCVRMELYPQGNNERWGDQEVPPKLRKTASGRRTEHKEGSVREVVGADWPGELASVVTW